MLLADLVLISLIQLQIRFNQSEHCPQVILSQAEKGHRIIMGGFYSLEERAKGAHIFFTFQVHQAKFACLFCADYVYRRRWIFEIRRLISASFRCRSSLAQKEFFDGAPAEGWYSLSVLVSLHSPELSLIDVSTSTRSTMRQGIQNLHNQTLHTYMTCRIVWLESVSFALTFQPWSYIKDLTHYYSSKTNWVHQAGSSSSCTTYILILMESAKLFTPKLVLLIVLTYWLFCLLMSEGRAKHLHSKAHTWSNIGLNCILHCRIYRIPQQFGKPECDCCIHIQWPHPRKDGNTKCPT